MAALTSHIRVAGAWKRINKMHVRIGGAWKLINKAYVRVRGVWKQIFSAGPSTISRHAAVSQSAQNLNTIIIPSTVQAGDLLVLAMTVQSTAANYWASNESYLFAAQGFTLIAETGGTFGFMNAGYSGIAYRIATSDDAGKTSSRRPVLVTDSQCCWCIVQMRRSSLWPSLQRTLNSRLATLRFRR